MARKKKRSRLSGQVDCLFSCPSGNYSFSAYTRRGQLMSRACWGRLGKRLKGNTIGCSLVSYRSLDGTPHKSLSVRRSAIETRKPLALPKRFPKVKIVRES